MAGMILRNIQTDANQWHFEIGHYQPDASWEPLHVFDDNTDASYDRALTIMNRLNGGSENRDLFAAAALQGLLSRDGEQVEDIFGSNAGTREKKRNALAGRSFDIADWMAEHVVRDWW